MSLMERSKRMAAERRKKEAALQEAIEIQALEDADYREAMGLPSASEKAWSVRGQLDGTGKLQNTDYVPFNQYMQMKRMAKKYPNNRAFQNIVKAISQDENGPNIRPFNRNSPSYKADMEATYIKGNSDTVPYNNMDTLAQGKGMAGLGIYRTDDSKNIYRPEGYNVPGNYRQAGTYNVGIDGVVRDNTISNTTPEAVYTATGKTFSGDGGNASGVVKEPYVAPTPKQTFHQWQDLNKKARNPDYEVGETAPEGPDMRIGNQFGYHKEPGQNFWDVNDTDPYWNNRVMGTGSAWSHADLKKPIQEIDIQAWKNFFSGN